VDSQIEIAITARDRDLGGFSVRRLLPYATHRMVGPFIFFDHMGPAKFQPGEGMDVRPHPHIGLATVTYLFSGRIFHQDSLGSKQLIEPGAINWMTAGKGIVHSERTPEDFRKTGGDVNGIQCWVALPAEMEDINPSFIHHPLNTLPEFKIKDVQFKLLLGEVYGHQSPVKVHSDLFYLEAKIPKGSSIKWPRDARECAVYIVDGTLQIGGDHYPHQTLLVLKPNQETELRALDDCRLMILGGSPVGQRFIWWNLVSSSQEKINEARKDWELGPRNDSSRFQKIPGDDQEFIPGPKDPPLTGNPKGTIM
jgi:redox-sensitive bicupin YhaK (pirin superfamily)